MAGIHISNDIYSRIIVLFPHDPILILKIKTIGGRRWHPDEKHWSFSSPPCPPHLREREGVKMLESPAFPVSRGLSAKSPLEDLRRETPQGNTATKRSRATPTATGILSGLLGSNACTLLASNLGGVELFIIFGIL